MLSGNDNRVNKNIFWLTGALQNQMLDHGDDFGIINVKGNNNMFVSNSLSCEWAYTDAVAVNATQHENTIVVAFKIITFNNTVITTIKH